MSTAVHPGSSPSTGTNGPQFNRISLFTLRSCTGTLPTSCGFCGCYRLSVGCCIARQQKREFAARVFAAGSMRLRLIPKFSNTRTWTKAVMVLAGLAALVVASARPKYGAYYEQVTQRGVDLFILLDVSRSMLAQDIAPSRLERAKSDIVDLLQRIPTDRVGLIVFAGKAVPRVPLTIDHTFFRQMLRDVDVDSAPIGGSLIGDAIRTGLASMEQHSDRDQVLVLITDGEDHDSFPLDAASLAAERGVRIITVGLGDVDEGARIPEQSDRADLGYVKDGEGVEHWSQMNEELLEQIALKTSGAYVPARTMAYDLGQIYDDHLSGLTRSELRSEKRKRFREQFQWFAGLGLALLVCESLLGRGGMTTAVVGLCLLLPTAPAGANDAVAQTRSGLKAFETGDFAKAAELFAAAAKSRPDDPRIIFNQACATAQGDTPDAARDLFYQSALARNVRLSANSHFNLGCLASDKAKQLLGDDPLQANKEVRAESLEVLTQALGHFRDALKSDPSHTNARHNLETLRLWIKQIKALWQQKDREQENAGKDALQMLKDMAARQLAQRSLLGEEAQKKASPARQEQIDKIHQQQRQLVDDVEPLQQKLIAQFVTGAQNPTATGGSPPAVDADQLAQAQQALEQWTTTLRENLTLAADRVLASEFDAARQSQRDSLENINQLYMAIAPFEDILQTAIGDQKSRNRQTEQLISQQMDDPDANDDSDPRPTMPDVDELAWRQLRIGSWAAALVAKAEQQLPMLEQAQAEQQHAPAAASNSAPANSAPANSAAPNANSPSTATPNTATPNTAAPNAPASTTDHDINTDLGPMIETMAKAIDLGPQVSELSREASQHLRLGQFKTALPKQEHALKLLEEIAEKLPRNDDQASSGQDQNNDGQKDPNQSNQNDQQDKQQDEGQQKGDDRQDPSQQDQDAPSDDQNPDQEDEQQQSPDEQSDSQKQADEKDKKQQQGQPADGEDADAEDSEEQPQRPQPVTTLSKAQIESILQRVRDRERQHRQVQKQLRNLMQKRARPERDW